MTVDQIAKFVIGVEPMPNSSETLSVEIPRWLPVELKTVQLYLHFCTMKMQKKGIKQFRGNPFFSYNFN